MGTFFCSIWPEFSVSDSCSMKLLSVVLCPCRLRSFPQSSLLLVSIRVDECSFVLFQAHCPRLSIAIHHDVVLQTMGCGMAGSLTVPDPRRDRSLIRPTPVTANPCACSRRLFVRFVVAASGGTEIRIRWSSDACRRSSCRRDLRVSCRHSTVAGTERVWQATN